MRDATAGPKIRGVDSTPRRLPGPPRWGAGARTARALPTYFARGCRSTPAKVISRGRATNSPCQCRWPGVSDRCRASRPDGAADLAPEGECALGVLASQRVMTPIQVCAITSGAAAPSARFRVRQHVGRPAGISTSRSPYMPRVAQSMPLPRRLADFAPAPRAPSPRRGSDSTPVETPRHRGEPSQRTRLARAVVRARTREPHAAC